jgi:hypothetical protein
MEPLRTKPKRTKRLLVYPPNIEFNPHLLTTKESQKVKGLLKNLYVFKDRKMKPLLFFYEVVRLIEHMGEKKNTHDIPVRPMGQFYNLSKEIQHKIYLSLLQLSLKQFPKTASVSRAKAACNMLPALRSRLLHRQGPKRCHPTKSRKKANVHDSGMCYMCSGWL